MSSAPRCGATAHLATREDRARAAAEGLTETPKTLCVCSRPKGHESWWPSGHIDWTRGTTWPARDARPPTKKAKKR